MNKNRLNEIRVQAILNILSGRAATNRPMGSIVVKEAILCANILVDKLQEEEHNTTSLD